MPLQKNWQQAHDVDCRGGDDCGAIDDYGGSCFHFKLSVTHYLCLINFHRQAR